MMIFPRLIKMAIMAGVAAATVSATAEFSFNAAEHWPQGELNCAHGYKKFDPLLQKEKYYVGVHAPAGIDTAWREFNLTFETYLNRAVGDRFIPPIRFEMKPTVDPLRDWVS